VNYEKMSKDQLHRLRKASEQELKKTIFSKDKMWQMDCRSKGDEEQRVRDYDRWKQSKNKLGITNDQTMSAWCECNREFKKRNEEGRLHSIDDIRHRKSVKYD